MKFKNLHRAIARIFFAGALSLVQPAAHAQWVVIDPANLAQAILDEINQLEHILLTNGMSIQQLKDYRLQLQNLQKLEGSLRTDVKNQLRQQLLNNIKDYGRSLLNRTTQLDPYADSYYMHADDIVRTGIGDVPRTTAATDADLNNLGLGTGQTSSIGASAYRDRQQYERVMDDMRQVSMTRKNSENRAVQANAISEKMSTLDDNNTVGAIQLLAAQNALVYGQNEDAIRTQAAALKNSQEEQLRALTERETLRKKELTRLSKARAEPQAPAINMIP